MSEALSLYEAFAEVPDPPKASGRRHPLQAVLTLAAVILSTLRNVTINLHNGLGVANKAAALRRHAAHPHEALRFVGPSG